MVLNDLESSFQVSVQMIRERKIYLVRELDVKGSFFSHLSLSYFERLPLQFCHCRYKKDI